MSEVVRSIWTISWNLLLRVDDVSQTSDACRDRHCYFFRPDCAIFSVGIEVRCDVSRVSNSGEWTGAVIIRK